jgi:NTE family protein
MLAYVLSGGGSLGALQAGALEVLLDHGPRPDLVVGSSAGALNAIFIAANPTPQGARAVQRVWERVQPARLGPPGIFTMARRFMFGRESLFSNEHLRDFLSRSLPEGVRTFGEMYDRTGVRALAVAVELRSGRVRVFGEARDDRLIDGAMASTALPPYYPPWPHGGERYLDGGVLANLPLDVAIDHGAEEAVLMDLHYAAPRPAESSMRDIGMLAISIMINRQTEMQIEAARRAGVRLHPIAFSTGAVAFFDFSHVEELVRLGRSAAEAYLLAGQPRLPGGATWRYRWRRLTGRALRRPRW